MFNKVQTAALEVLSNNQHTPRERQEALETLMRTPEKGMPATFYIGTDSYAMKVVWVTYFMSGARAGQVREVMAQIENRAPERFVMTKAGRLAKKDPSGNYGSLVIGYARDYRDPSF